ncbi:MAG: hypothetical protein HZB51_24455 [Chloroflexi bacterium]|nr:hypothetical protein [Chloroflexota bacterium]
MWVIVEYQPTTLFSLRPASATTGGGKTLVTPTPFALKMALLDAAIRVRKRERGEQWFEQIRDLAIAVRLPKHFAVVSTFSKIRKPLEIKEKKKEEGRIAKAKSEKKWPWDSSISFREFVQFGGAIQLAFEESGDVPLLELLAQINYLGKRGCFVQFTGRTEKTRSLPPEFTRLNPGQGAPFLADGFLQVLDDCGPKMEFEHADIYSGKGISLNEPNGRILTPVVLPYRAKQSSRGFVLFERI